MTKGALKKLLDKAVKKYNHKSFIDPDPISIPHQFSSLQDREFIGFWIAMLAWGNRTTIINSGKRLVELMDGAPYDFVLNHKEKDRKRFESFKHRTFQFTDSLYFLGFFQQYYQQHKSLEDAFCLENSNMKIRLEAFHDFFFSLRTAPKRTRKHVATPSRGSSCKRLNMYLRWMVRTDKSKVDFGHWKKIKPPELMIPYDVHVQRVALKLKLVSRKQADWKAVEELTNRLRELDPKDPIKYDYALFGMGLEMRGAGS